MDDALVNRIVDAVMARLGPSVTDGDTDSDLVTPDIRAGRVPVGVSARHCHLTPEHVEILFGPSARLTVFKPLLQPGEFASEQQMTLVGPTGKTLGPVRVLGPERKASQVEISLTDCFALGLKRIPPIRSSGDHRDAPGIIIVGPAGSVTLKTGLIRANRHVHLQTSQAEAMGLKDNDTVHVQLDGERPAVLLGVQVRAHKNFRAQLHLDTDDANAVGVKSGDLATLIKAL